MTIVDRKKDMVLRGGFNVYPREVEEVLARHPAVAQVAVIGLPDPTYGEEVCAVVKLVDDGSGRPVTEVADEVIAWSREHLAGHKYPRIVKVVEEFPSVRPARSSSANWSPATRRPDPPSLRRPHGRPSGARLRTGKIATVRWSGPARRRPTDGRPPDRDGSGVALAFADQPYLEAVVRKSLDQPRAPFDDGHGLLQRRLEIEVRELGERADPVGVDMDEGHRSRMYPRDHERRRRHRSAHAETGTDALRQGRLAGAEATGEDDEVARAQHRSQRTTERPHRGWVAHRHRQHQRGHHGADAASRATRSRSSRSAAIGTPAGPKRIAAEG